MIITVVCDVLGKENNGTTIAAMNLIRALRDRGHTVRVVCPDPERKGEKDYYVVPRMNLGPFNGYIAKNGVALSRPDRHVLDSALDGADRVHIMIPLSLGSAAAKIAVKRGIPITAGFHCQAENLTGHTILKNVAAANRAAYRFFYRRLYRYCNLIHYPSQFICDTFESVVGPTPHRVISNGVNRCFVPKDADRPDELKGKKYTVLFIGRYGPEKNHEVLIDAAALSHHRDEIQLVFAGDGPRREKLIRRAEKRGIPMPVMKFYDRETLIDIINCADLYVHPAEIEIEAIACLEAIACGRVPLIADSPRSATRYFALTDRNLVHYNDPYDLAVRMDWWLEHPEERRLCAEDYLGYAKQFDFEFCMDRMEQMIRDAGEEQSET